MSAAPQPVTVLDENLRRTINAVHKQRWVFLAALLAAMAAALVLLGLLAWQEHQQLGVQHRELAADRARLAVQDRELHASCQWWLLLAPLPVTIPKGSARPSVLSVGLIAGARNAYAGQGCGVLPPADPSVVRWAKRDGIPVR